VSNAPKRPLANSIAARLRAVVLAATPAGHNISQLVSAESSPSGKLSRRAPSQWPVIAALFLAALTSNASMATSSYVLQALADPHRSADVAIDGWRHPIELAEFAQVKPGDTVVDLVPGSGYFTRIFSQIVGPKGHVYAVWPAEYARIDRDEVNAIRALVRDPHYANVTMLVQPAAKFEIPTQANVVWTSQNFHDYLCKFMGPVDMQRLSSMILRSLQPGGVFVVIDHAAQEGSGLRFTEATHRADPQLVTSLVTSGGFKFDGESNVLRNPLDSHTLLVFNPLIRGRTDQFAFRFRSAQQRP
jgi:predicted methyltransferase